MRFIELDDLFESLGRCGQTAQGTEPGPSRQALELQAFPWTTRPEELLNARPPRADNPMEHQGMGASRSIGRRVPMAGETGLRAADHGLEPK